MQKLSIVIPAYNEEKRIGRTIDAYSEYLDRMSKKEKIEYEILVVINNTSDRTESVVQLKQKNNKNIRYINFKRGGKGFAVLEGFKNALKRENNLIGFVDADLATPPWAFYALVKNIKNYDGLIASRWHKKSVITTPQTLLRKITSNGFNFLVKSILFLNFSDTQCGAKIFKSHALREIVNEPGLTEWAFDIDLLYRLKRKGFKISEIPTIWQDVEGSKVNLKSVPLQMFVSIMRIRLLNSPFKFIVKLYDNLPEGIKSHHNS